MISINNRRYIGSKTKLLDEIESVIPSNILKTNFSFADIFAGTGVVAYHFRNRASKLIVNDILYCNIVAYRAFFSSQKVNKLKLKKIIHEFNLINGHELKSNYFSKIYGNKYFSASDAKKIGYIRDYLEENKNLFNEREYFILLTSIIYFADKIANTCGHFESFLSNKPKDTQLQIELPDIEEVNNVSIFNQDANTLVKEIYADVVYLDPPYNARQYVNFYHVLENLARWEKPKEFEGNSMKFKRDSLKSGYSKSKAPQLFADLVANIKAKVIVVSYNNTYNAKSGASNNKIQEEEILQILKAKGNVTVKEIAYKFFNAGKTDFKNHLEKLYICEVK